MITAPTIEPIRPLGFNSAPSPAIRLDNSPPTNEPPEAGNERNRPVDRPALPPEEELGECADEDAESEDGENEHRRTISP